MELQSLFRFYIQKAHVLWNSLQHERKELSVNNRTCKAFYKAQNSTILNLWLNWNSVMSDGSGEFFGISQWRLWMVGTTFMSWPRSTVSYFFSFPQRCTEATKSHFLTSQHFARFDLRPVRKIKISHLHVNGNVYFSKHWKKRNRFDTIAFCFHFELYEVLFNLTMYSILYSIVVKFMIYRKIRLLSEVCCIEIIS